MSLLIPKQPQQDREFGDDVDTVVININREIARKFPGASSTVFIRKGEGNVFGNALGKDSYHQMMRHEFKRQAVENFIQHQRKTIIEALERADASDNPES